MSRVTLDEQSLAGVGERAAICDASGAVVGYFQPISKLPLGTPYEPTFSKEELDQYAREPGGRTLTEIFADWLKRRS